MDSIPGLSRFADDLASRAASRILTLSFASATAFAGIGFGAWLYAHGGSKAWERAIDWSRSGSVTMHVLVLFLMGLGLLIAAVLSETLALPVLRLLEGYWPRLLAPIRGPLVRREQHRAQREEELLEIRAEQDVDGTGDETARLLKRLGERPAAIELIMPTRLGNVLRAHETSPAEKYGLDPVRFWVQLWLLLPGEVTAEITSARQRLDAGAVAWFWAVLSVVWVFWAWWAAPLGIVLALGLYRGLLVSRADTYGALIEAAFDLFRVRLYKASRWPLPEAPINERATGLAFAQFLIYGHADAAVRYSDADESSAAEIGEP